MFESVTLIVVGAVVSAVDVSMEVVCSRVVVSAVVAESVDVAEVSPAVESVGVAVDVHGTATLMEVNVPPNLTEVVV